MRLHTEISNFRKWISAFNHRICQILWLQVGIFKQFWSRIMLYLKGFFVGVFYLFSFKKQAHIWNFLKALKVAKTII